MGRLRPTAGHRQVATVLGWAVIAVGLCTGTASAHTYVESTDPKAGSTVREAPRSVLIRFTEPAELAFGGIEVFDPDGRRVDAGETEYASEDQTSIRVGVEPELTAGTYRVEWRVLAQDGHPRDGRFRFKLDLPAEPTPTPHSTPETTPTSPAAGPGGPPASEEHETMGAGTLPSVLLGITRWILFASILVLVGVGAFAFATWDPLARADRPAEVDEEFRRRLRPLVAWAWVGAVVASVSSLAFEGAVAADVPLREAVSGEVLGALMTTQFGVVTAVRVGLLVLLGAALLEVRVGQDQRVLVPAEARRSLGAAAVPARAGRWSLAGWALLGLALLATVSLTGHAGTSSPLALGIGADVAHLAAGAIWVGGLIGLAALAFPATRRRSDGERVSLLAPVVSRFSNLAVWSVALLVATGTIRGWMEIRTLAGLTGESYGIALLVKLAVVIPLLILGAVNNRWTKPRIRRAAQEATQTESGTSGLRTLNRLVVLEVLLAAVVLAVTAVLVAQSPPAGEMGGTH
jgi:copper transport protein